MMKNEFHAPAHRRMLPIRGLVLPLILALAACGGAPAPEHAPETQADPVDEGTRIAFSGQVLIDGDLAREAHGAILVSVRYVGGRNVLLQRSYEIGDPWRSGDSIQFGLSAEDKVVDKLPVFARRMSLVVRFDADGNPATDERDNVEVETTVKTGASDIAVVLRRSEADAPRAARAGSK
jgi:hypothetical protein